MLETAGKDIWIRKVAKFSLDVCLVGGRGVGGRFVLCIKS